MDKLEERNFTHNGKSFVLRLFKANAGFVVIAYLGDEQVSPSYGVTFEVNGDYFGQYQQRLTDHLFDIAQSDIENNVYIGA